MSTPAHTSLPPAKLLGETLYDELRYATIRAQDVGRDIAFILIGREALTILNAWLTVTQGKPTTLNEVDVCGRADIPILLDDEQPLRVAALAVK